MLAANPKPVGVQRTDGETTDQVPRETSMNVPTAQWLADNGSNPTHGGFPLTESVNGVK